MPDMPSTRFSRHITHRGLAGHPAHGKREYTMNDWTTVVDVVGALLNLTAAIIALIIARSQRPGK
jgi:hypothetical protein